MIIPSSLQDQLQLLLKTGAPPLLEVAEVDALSKLNLNIGDRLQAQVLTQLPNGRYLAKIDQQVIDLNLPVDTQAGEQVDLTVVGTPPKLTFVLSRDLQTSQEIVSKPETDISQSAKFLGSLLNKINKSDVNQLKAEKSAPILEAAPTDIKNFATALKSTLSKSGIFYESHQAQWVSGERSIETLLQEPQGKLSPRLTDGEGKFAAPQTVSSSADEASVKQTTSVQEQSVAQNGVSGKEDNASKTLATKFGLDDVSSGALKTTDDDARPSLLNKLSMPSSLQANDYIHPKTLPLLQQQVEVLDNRQLFWKGEVWPQQEMEWEIKEYPDTQTTESTVWQTHLKLDLPNLGEVTVLVGLRQHDLQLNFRVENPQTGVRLNENKTELQQALNKEGLNVASWALQQRDASE